MRVRAHTYSVSIKRIFHKLLDKVSLPKSATKELENTSSSNQSTTIDKQKNIYWSLWKRQCCILRLLLRNVTKSSSHESISKL
jgi:hypothetical protein